MRRVIEVILIDLGVFALDAFGAGRYRFRKNRRR
jgi:hypothetical protein